MERYRHYGTSYTSSPGAAHVEEIHAEEEEEEEVEEVMYTEEEVEPLLEDETQPLLQETGRTEACMRFGSV